MRNVELTNEGHDIFGDGSLVLIATPGHTMGHQSLMLRDGARRIVLAGDVAYLHDNLRLGVAPRLSTDHEAATASIQRLLALQAEGWAIVVAQDPEDPCHGV